MICGQWVASPGTIYFFVSQEERVEGKAVLAVVASLKRVLAGCDGSPVQW